jgi:DNA processing protein
MGVDNFSKGTADQENNHLGERSYWLAWSQIPGIGPVLLRRLEQHFGTLAAAWVRTAEELQEVEGLGQQLSMRIAENRSILEPQKFLEEHLIKNPHFWTPADPDYPRLLLETPNPPPVLYYRGKPNPLESQGITPAIAIVGTRDPSPHGKKWTKRIVTALANRGFLIVSGMAAGIDTEAHRACLEAGQRTIAVLGTGIDIAYPPRNQGLYRDIVKQGLVVSEYPQGTPPDRPHFPQRNRIIAGLCRAVLVMEAPIKSGALITAYIANEYNRDVYVLPDSPDNIKGLGCLSLLSKGAHPFWHEDQLLEMLGEMPNLDTPPSSSPQPNQQELFTTPPPAIAQLPPNLLKVWQAIPPEPITLDAIVQAMQTSAAEVAGALLQLELLGLITQLPGMRYQRN